MDYRLTEPIRLMAAYYDGDDEAMDAIVTRFFGRLAVHFQRFVSVEDAEDLALETLVRVARTRLAEWSSGRFDCKRGSFEPWLFRIARNVKYDHLSHEQGAPEEIRFDEDIDRHDDDTPSPQELLEAAEFDKTVRACVAEFRPLDREAATLFLEGFTLKEVAIICEIPYGTAGRRRSYALSRLRACLEAKGFRP
jgi:RNA polymerase sigma factor (sigma-70 family)